MASERLKNGRVPLAHIPIAYIGSVSIDHTTNHSDRCLEAFHCSSAVNGSCPIETCPIEHHPPTSPGAQSFSTGPPIRKLYIKLANRRCGLSEPSPKKRTSTSWL